MKYKYPHEKNMIGNGLDDAGNALKHGKTYALYTFADCSNNPDGYLGAIQCGELGEYDDTEGMFLDARGEPIDSMPEFAHLQI